VEYLIKHFVVLIAVFYNCIKCVETSVCGTVSPPQYIWLLGFCNYNPDDVELTANTSSSCGEQHRFIWMIT